jgi:hypothetical protein
MNRTRANFLIDAIAFVAFILLTTTGVLMRYLLPPGSGHYSVIWGMDRHEWGGVHFWISVALFAVLALHLVLHSRWIVSVVTGRPRSESSGVRAGLGGIGLVTVIALGVAPLMTPVTKRTTAALTSSPLSAHKYEAIPIRGSMTLHEVEQATGVPASSIISALMLPPSTSPNERLGFLKRTYGFEINDVRELVKQYKEAHP